MGTAAQPIPYFGRAFSIGIDPQNGSPGVLLQSSQATPTLRVLFTVETLLLTLGWQASITIYNLERSLSTAISNGAAYSQAGNINLAMIGAASGVPLLQYGVSPSTGDIVTLSAGYQFNSPAGFNPVSNRLYIGSLLQSLKTRENVVDTKLTLRCLTNLAALSFGFTSFARSPGQSDYDVVTKIFSPSSQGGVGLAIESIDSASQQALQSAKYPSSQAINGRPFPIISEIARQHNLFSWIGAKGLNIRSPASLTGALVPKFVYGPPNLAIGNTGAPASTTIRTTLIGVPEQTQQGITFKILMDSQVSLWDIVQLAPGTAINGYQFPYPGLPPLPNPAGVYVVSGLKHVGDSRGRGGDWYTEVTALTPKFMTQYVKAYTPGTLGKSSLNP